MKIPTKYNIVLIEDNIDDIELIRRIASKHPLKPHLMVFSNGGEALNYLNTESIKDENDQEKKPDIVLLDLMLPNMNGFRVLESLRLSESYRYLPVIIFTSSNEIKDVNMRYNMGANSFVQKPVDFKKYTTTIYEVLNYWLNTNLTPTISCIHPS